MLIISDKRESMEKLLCPNIRPITHTHQDFLSRFEELASQSDSLRIASGYISTDSIVHLRHYVHQLRLSNCELLVGMHYFDGITKPEFEALGDFDYYLRSNALGEIDVFTAFPYHGKLYLFQKNSTNFAALLGSSNLSAIEHRRQFEIDAEISSRALLEDLNNLYDQFKAKATKPIDSWNPAKFKETSGFLAGCTGVTRMDDSQKSQLWSTASALSFDIPVKSTPKSNLNAFFGRGRENTRTGVIRPRPWYEVELIVPKRITAMRGYPVKRSDLGRVITVFTDDGWSFRSKISGDYSKNFRSADDLKTLGLWIKGRLENKGVLKVGEPVTRETLRQYGRDTIRLTATNVPDVWLLDFGV